MKNPELEFKILGSILLNNECLTDVNLIIKPEVFADNRNRLVYESILKLYDDNKSIDSITIADQMSKDDTLNAIGGINYLSKFAEVSTSANVLDHCRIIKESYYRRVLNGLGDELKQKSSNMSNDTFDVLEEAKNEINSIDIDSNIDLSITRHLQDAVNITEKIRENGNLDFLMDRSGFHQLDDYYPITKVDLVFIGARVKQGKTTFLVNKAYRKSILGQRGYIVPYEMTPKDWIYRFIAIRADLPYWDVKIGKCSHLPEYKEAVETINNFGLIMDDTFPSFNELKSKIRYHHKKDKIDYVVIDYLQLIKTNKTFQNRDIEIGHITRELKELTIKLNIPIYIASQLNRAVDSRQDKTPQLSDLRESGNIEADAGKVIFLYRPETYGVTSDENGNPTEGIMNIIVAANREGNTGQFKLKMIGEKATLTDIPPDFEAIENNII